MYHEYFTRNSKDYVNKVDFRSRINNVDSTAGDIALDAEGPPQTSSYFVSSLADGSWLSFIQRSDWEILLMDAILDVHTEDGKHQTIRVTIPDNKKTAPLPADCSACKSQPTPTPTPPPAQGK